jgi:hypothetical protein
MTCQKEKLRKIKSVAVTNWRIAAWVSRSRALDGQLLLVAEWVDSPKDELFGVVTRLKLSPMEFGNQLHQRLQTTWFFQSLPFICDQWRKAVLVRPLGRIIEIDVKPSGGAFPATLEGYIQVLHPAVAMQRQPQARKHNVLIACRRIEIPEYTGVRQNAKPAFTQHAKVAERCNSVRV